MAKIYPVIEIKLNQLLQENVHMITALPTQRILSAITVTKHLSEFLPTRWRKNQLA